MFVGLRRSPEDVLTTTFDLGHDELVLVKDIEVWSMCEHHLVPFHGHAHVGYIPSKDGRITGLSKLARLVDVFAKRPQVQERLTTQVADSLMDILKPRGVITVFECEHLCMTMRGVSKPGSKTVTSAVRGQLRDPATRAEAMSLILGAVTSVVAGLPTPGRCLVMGIVNVTPDSFSDGGRWAEPRGGGRPRPRPCGRRCRPGRHRRRVDPARRRRDRRREEELDRVLPVVSALDAAGVLVVSVDTMRAEVARSAVEAGARVVNDVSGGLRRPRDAALWSPTSGWRTSRCTGAGTARPMQELASYDDVVADVIAELGDRVEQHRRAGIDLSRRRPRPRHRLRQDRRAQLGAADRLLGRCIGLGFPVVVGYLAQGVPRRAARRRRRSATRRRAARTPPRRPPCWPRWPAPGASGSTRRGASRDAIARRRPLGRGGRSP